MGFSKVYRVIIRSLCVMSEGEIKVWGWGGVG